MRNTILLTAALLLCGVTAQAQQTPPPGGTPRDFNLPEHVTYTLSNGMGVTLVPWGTLPKASVSLVVRVGNIDEGADQVWLADLTGDVMGEGTTSQSAEAVRALAASMGGSVNINVGMDRTTIAGDVLSEFAPRLIDLIADVTRSPLLPESELERLKNDRVRQVSVSLAQPRSMTLARFRGILYPDHPYGRLYPTEEMIRGYTIDQIRDFHEDNFGAARSHLYVAGRFDVASVRAAVESSFRDWESGTPPTINVPEPIVERAVHTIDRPGAEQSTIYLGLPVVDPSHPDWVTIQLTNTLLGGSFASRVTSNIREDKGYTYSPRSTLSTRYRDSYWVQVADVTTDVTGASLDEIFYEINRLQEETPSPEELAGFRNYRAGIFVLQNSTRGGIISRMAFLRLHGLDLSFLENYVENIYQVTPEDIQRVAREYLRDEDMLLVVAGDAGVIEEQLARHRGLTP